MRALRNLIILFVLSYFPFAAMASEYYVCQAYYGGSAPILKIDEAGNVLDAIPIVLNGESSKGCFGLAAHPKTNKLYAIIDVVDYDAGNRTIVEVNESTGQAREIADLDDFFASLAFDSQGNLYTLCAYESTDCSTDDSKEGLLYKVNFDTGTASLVSDAFADIYNEPHSIAYNPEDGYMYYIGNDDFFGNATNYDVLAKMDLNTGNIVDTELLTGDNNEPEYAFVWDPSKETFVGLADDDEFSEMTAGGVVTLIDDEFPPFSTDGYPRGIAIKVATFDVPTLSAAGLGLLALLLGAIGVLVYRRKPKL